MGLRSLLALLELTNRGAGHPFPQFFSIQTEVPIGGAHLLFHRIEIHVRQKRWGSAL